MHICKQPGGRSSDDDDNDENNGDDGGGGGGGNEQFIDLQNNTQIETRSRAYNDMYGKRFGVRAM